MFLLSGFGMVLASFSRLGAFSTWLCVCMASGHTCAYNGALVSFPDVTPKQSGGIHSSDVLPKQQVSALLAQHLYALVQILFCITIAWKYKRCLLLNSWELLDVFLLQL